MEVRGSNSTSRSIKVIPVNENEMIRMMIREELSEAIKPITEHQEECGKRLDRWDTTWLTTLRLIKIVIAGVTGMILFLIQVYEKTIHHFQQ